MKILGLLLALFVALAATASPRSKKATFVYVHKTSRQIFLFDGKILLAKYPIALGRSPLGHKKREGDKKTPEGRYLLDYKNPNSRYYLSIHVSYPNAQDKKRARELGVSPGGDIMIHGQPNGSSYASDMLQRTDWTDGCIALTNEQMDQVWGMVDVPVTIQIAP